MRIQVTKAELVEIKPHSWITTNRFFLSADRKIIVKYHCQKKRRFRHYRYRVLQLIGYPVPYEFRSEAARCAHERAVYAHWHSLGYKVPRLIEDGSVELPGPKQRCLVLEFIDGRVLSEILADPTVPSSQKLGLIAKQFSRCSARHDRVFKGRDRNLIKYDANLRNIILHGDELFDLDFECGRVLESLDRGVAREISRYATEAIKFVGVEHCAAIVACLRQEYRRRHILDKIAKAGRGKRSSGSQKFSSRDLAALLSR